MVGTGRGVEELPRAVVQRGIRAVLRGASTPKGLAGRSLHQRPPADARVGPVECDEGSVYLGYRLGHIKDESRSSGPGLQQGRGHAAHAPPMLGDDASSAGVRRFYRELKASARLAPRTSAGALEADSGRSLGAFFRALDLRPGHADGCGSSGSWSSVGRETSRQHPGAAGCRCGQFEFPVTVTTVRPIRTAPRTPRTVTISAGRTPRCERPLKAPLQRAWR